MTRAASNGRPAEPFDLDQAAKAAAAEGDASPFAFTFRGEAYEVPPALAWPLEAQRFIGRGELEPGLAMLLGGDQYERLIKAGITVGDLATLFEAIGQPPGWQASQTRLGLRSPLRPGPRGRHAGRVRG